MKKIRTLNLGREKVDVYFDNFEYFQPNTHKCGDCHVRCICAATGLSWLEALDGLYGKARAIQEPVGSTDSITAFLKDLGFEWKAIKPKRGESRPIVSEFAKKHKNDNYIMRVSNHVVGGKNGKYMDIWDCGNKSLYGYWVKKK